MVKCILFDRDGTLGEPLDERFPTSFVKFSGVEDTFARLKELGYTVGVISNQSSIARGTAGDYDFVAEFTGYGAQICEICPHDDCDDCDCRKPKSGMVLDAAQKLCLKPCEILVVGDRWSDAACARNVGGKAILVLTGSGKEHLAKAKELFPDLIVCNRFDEIFDVLPSL